MTDSIIQQTARGGALNAEHYQNYEMAKANDDVLGGDNIAQIRSYAAYARAQAQAIHKTIAATNGIDDVAAIKAEATETAQTFAKVGIYADQRIGEILRELPTKQGARTDVTSMGTTKEVTKGQAIKEASIDVHTSYDLQALAENPEVVQAVLDKAEAEGRIPSRKQVLDAIKEKKRAEQERDEAREDLQDAYMSNEVLEKEVENLKRRVSEKPKPEVVEKTVEKTVEVVPEAMQKRVSELEHLERLHSEDTQKLRKCNEELRRELDKAKDILGMDKTMQDVRLDAQYLINATNGYVRRYGGLTWTVQSLKQIDELTRKELHKAAVNLATFASTLVASLEEMK